MQVLTEQKLTSKECSVISLEITGTMETIDLYTRHSGYGYKVRVVQGYRFLVFSGTSRIVQNAFN